MRITENTSDSNMKILLLFVFCAVTGYAAGGAIGWPGAVALSEPVLKTVVPGQTKTTAYSTTQYINSLPPSYTFGVHPQFSYHEQQFSGFAPFPSEYYPIGNPSYIPGSGVFYPAHPSLVPAFEPSPGPGVSLIPGFPSSPSFPGSPAPVFPPGLSEPPNVQPPPLAGDEDSAVIESADNIGQEGIFSRNQPTPQPNQHASPQVPSFNTLPNFPSNSGPQHPTSFPQQPLISQTPQKPQEVAQNPTNFPFHQFPQKPHEPSLHQPISGSPEASKPSFPYLPPTSNPQFPQFSQTPQKPQESAPPSSQQPHIPNSQHPSHHHPQTPQDSKPSIPHSPHFPQNPQGSAPSFPQHQQIPHFPHDSKPSFPQFPQISQNPQGPSNFNPQFAQNPQGPTQGFGPNGFSGPSQSFASSFPGTVATNGDSSTLNDEDTISVESA